MLACWDRPRILQNQVQDFHKLTLQLDGSAQDVVFGNQLLVKRRNEQSPGGIVGAFGLVSAVDVLEHFLVDVACVEIDADGLLSFAFEFLAQRLLYLRKVLQLVRILAHSLCLFFEHLGPVDVVSL